MKEVDASMDTDTWVAGTSMLRRLLDDDLVVARAIRERRYADLYAVAAGDGDDPPGGVESDQVGDHVVLHEGLPMLEP